MKLETRDEAPPGASDVTPSRTSQRRLVFLVLAVAAALSALLLLARPRSETAPIEISPPLVRVVAVRPEGLRLDVRAEGTVRPRTASELVAEVAGRVVELSPSLVQGGFFAGGEVLIRLDEREARIAVERAEAIVERRASEAELAQRALERRRALSLRGAVSDADVDGFASRERVARAVLREARADQGRARLDLERSVLRAPYAGRVLKRHVDLGQYVQRGTPTASLYAVDWAEVRLPVPDAALADLGLSLAFEAEGDRDPAAPRVELEARVAGRHASWSGAIVRVEGQIDPRTRMVTLVARVANPYGRVVGNNASPPLAAGLFVTAHIAGREVAGVYRLPPGALRGGDRVLLVDDEERLRFRPVSVLRRDRDAVWIEGGLAPADLVCVSFLDLATDGMRVRYVEVPGPAADAPLRVP